MNWPWVRKQVAISLGQKKKIVFALGKPFAFPMVQMRKARLKAKSDCWEIGENVMWIGMR